MSLIDLLKQEAEETFAATEGLFKLVGENQMDWKPATGKNWLTVGQLVMHSATSCGGGIKGFVTGDWGMPEGVSFEDMKPEDMLPPAEKFPSVGNIGEALTLLAEDKKTAMKFLSEVDESILLTQRSSAPWGNTEFTLFQHLHHMVDHLAQHKGQLFYYLKLMNKDVSTKNLWGGM